jgi:pilus assembly protein Flp/PilA
MERIKNFFKDESGASAVEYGLLVALIAVGLIAFMGTLRTAVSEAFTKASPPITTAKGK